MSSYLFVTFLGCGSFLEVQASEDGVLSETLFDLQLGLLHTAFFIKLGLLFLPLFLQGLVVGEEIKLLGSTILLQHFSSGRHNR